MKIFWGVQLQNLYEYRGQTTRHETCLKPTPDAHKATNMFKGNMSCIMKKIISCRR